MNRAVRYRRKLLLALVMIPIMAVLCITTGYGIYLRSDRYRGKIEEQVKHVLGMPITIERVVPLGASSRAFDGISVTLPARGNEIFRCDRAVWNVGKLGYFLDLIDGWLLVGTHAWSPADYRTVLHSSLGHDLREMNLRRIRLEDIDLQWSHPDWTVALNDAQGGITYDPDGTGRATLVAYELNGQSFGEPVQVLARFTPGGGVIIHEAVLEVPPIALGKLGLDHLLGAAVTRGTFRGMVAYRQSQDQESIELAGSISDAALEELTSRMPGGPFCGIVDVGLDEAVFVGRRLEVLRFTGRIEDLDLGKLFPVLQEGARSSPAVAGPRLQLRVHQGSVRGSVIDHLSADGRVTDLSLDALCELIGRGAITGSLRVRIRALQIVDDELRYAEVEVEAVPPADRPGTIDRPLLQWATHELTGLDLGRLIPERVEYARLAMTLVIEGEELRVRGTHGLDARTVLTVRILGRDMPLIKAPSRSFHVGPVIQQVRRLAAGYDAQRVRSLWEAMHRPPPEP